MESATIITLLALSEPNIPEGPKYDKNINTISIYGDVFWIIMQTPLTFFKGGGGVHIWQMIIYGV